AKRRARGDVVWTRHQNQDPGSQSARDETGVWKRTAADGDIVLFGDQIDVAVGEMYFDRDVRVPGAVFANGCDELGRCEVGGCRDAKRARRVLAATDHSFAGLEHGGHRANAALVKVAPGFGHGETTRRAHE